ncbi:MAG TPA: hypothetical protein VFS21_19300 [Roseiflexaceae bacterium]|nr:hypothetical protein [Roseiflexaceae bacterium]
MSITFFINPFTPANWQHQTSDLRIDPADYEQALRSQWPGAEISVPPPASSYLLAWRLRTNEALGLSGGLQRDQQTVSFEVSDAATIYAFIRWHRRYVSRQHDLFLHTTVADDYLALTATTTDEAIEAFISRRA